MRRTDPQRDRPFATAPALAATRDHQDAYITGHSVPGHTRPATQAAEYRIGREDVLIARRQREADNHPPLQPRQRPITTGGQARTLQPLDVLAQIEPAVLAVMTVE